MANIGLDFFQTLTEDRRHASRLYKKLCISHHFLEDQQQLWWQPPWQYAESGWCGKTEADKILLVVHILLKKIVKQLEFNQN